MPHIKAKVHCFFACVFLLGVRVCVCVIKVPRFKYHPELPAGAAENEEEGAGNQASIIYYAAISLFPLQPPDNATTPATISQSSRTPSAATSSSSSSASFLVYGAGSVLPGVFQLFIPHFRRRASRPGLLCLSSTRQTHPLSARHTVRKGSSRRRISWGTAAMIGKSTFSRRIPHLATKGGNPGER